MQSRLAMLEVLPVWILLVIASACSGVPPTVPTATSLSPTVAIPTLAPPTPTLNIASDTRLEVTPSKALADTPVSIRLLGLKAQVPVTLRARTKDDGGNVWESNATFQASDPGTLDLTTNKPISGTYQDLDPMGLFWSMNIQPEREAATPFVKTGLTPITIDLNAEINGKTIASAQLERLFIAPDVAQTTVNENGLAGIFSKPSGPGKFPAIILVGGSEGGINFGKNNGAMLASHGYATLGLAYFNYQGLPPNLVNIPLEYFETAIRWLQSRSDIQADKIAVVGVSRGGELALILGSTFPQLKAVVAYVPSNVVVSGYGNNVSRNQPAWTYQGSPLKINSAIPVEKTNGPILIISAGDDKVWPSAPMSELVIQRLDGNKFPLPYKNLFYKGAGHAAGFPYMPTTEETKPRKHPVTGAPIASGGTPKDNAFLKSDSWQYVLKLLQESLK